MFIFHPGSPKTGTTYLMQSVFPHWGNVVMGWHDVRSLEAENVIYSASHLWSEKRWGSVLKWSHVADKVIVGTRDPDETAASWRRTLIAGGFSERHADDSVEQFQFGGTFKRAAALKEIYGEKVFVYDFKELLESPRNLVDRMADFIGVDRIQNLSVAPKNKHPEAWKVQLLGRVSELYPREKWEHLPPIRSWIMFRAWNVFRGIVGAL